MGFSSQPVLLLLLVVAVCRAVSTTPGPTQQLQWGLRSMAQHSKAPGSSTRCGSSSSNSNGHCKAAQQLICVATHLDVAQTCNTCCHVPALVTVVQHTPPPPLLLLVLLPLHTSTPPAPWPQQLQCMLGRAGCHRRQQPQQQRQQDCMVLLPATAAALHMQDTRSLLGPAAASLSGSTHNSSSSSSRLSTQELHGRHRPAFPTTHLQRLTSAMATVLSRALQQLLSSSSSSSSSSTAATGHQSPLLTFKPARWVSRPLPLPQLQC
jgi:hypothetical protein